MPNLFSEAKSGNISPHARSNPRQKFNSRRTDKMLQRGDRSRLPVFRFAVGRKKFTLCDSRRIFRFPLFGRNDDRKTANRKNGYRSSFSYDSIGIILKNGKIKTAVAENKQIAVRENGAYKLYSLAKIDSVITGT